MIYSDLVPWYNIYRYFWIGGDSNLNYCIIMKYSAKENCYIVTVPDLPGCMADGQTPSEAYENVKIVMGEWMETARADGRPIPEPVFGRDKF